MTIFARALCIAGSALAIACSSATPAPALSDAGQSAAGLVSCGVASDTYVANLVKPGVNGKYTFTLVQGTPAPPDLDANAWTVKIADASGHAPSLSQVAVSPFMPQMGHGSDQTPQIAANADGTFTVSDIYLFMAGLWTVTLTVNALASEDAGAGHAPTMIDDAVYTFCIN